MCKICAYKPKINPERKKKETWKKDVYALSMNLKSLYC